MNVSTNVSGLNHTSKSNVIKPLYTEKLSRDDVRDIKEQIQKNANAFTFNSTSIQKNILSVEDKFNQEYDAFVSFLSDIGYEGKPIADLSQEEATELVSENGFFGVFQTSERIANFVVAGAGGDESMLRAGREGMIQGFQEAEQLWGGELPEISQETMKRAIELVDTAMHDLGFSIIDKEV
ncbi:hypothetical protein N9A28_05340 [Sulfurimonas sp.]|nr:hypothetical protein [Sulfurimonas sp.]